MPDSKIYNCGWTAGANEDVYLFLKLSIRAPYGVRALPKPEYLKHDYFHYVVELNGNPVLTLRGCFKDFPDGALLAKAKELIKILKNKHLGAQTCLKV